VPTERVTLVQAIEAYTLGAAWAVHRDRDEGSIAPGKLADLIVVSSNVFEADPHTLAATNVLLTMVGGRVVHDELTSR